MTKPKVAFIGTGGTMSSLGRDSLDILDYSATGNRLEADEILARVPEAAEVAEVIPVRFRAVPSPQINVAEWRELVMLCDSLVAAHPDALPPAELKVALGLHTRSTRYIEAVASGLARHDLQGKPVEPVAPEHVQHAILELYKRRRGKAPEQARERAVAQLAAAVEASGLTREAYRERFTSPDDEVHAMLEEALSLVAQRGARREALQKAFTASGKTVAEFAEMYGLDAAETKRLLGA